MQIKDIIASNSFELALISGDLTTRGPLKMAKRILETLLEQLPILIVPGNMDPPELTDLLNQLNVNIHGKGVIIGGVGFAGAGADRDIGNLLSAAVRNVTNFTRTLVFVTHYPPYRTKADLTWDGAHIGSPEVRDAVEKYQPAAVFCGHVHEARSIEYLGKTVVCNPGPVNKGFYATVNISEKVEIELSRL